ncbi:thiamine-phosphate kinase [uncultured Castellaniella sp.]|uniref:thiamine-phosphate kinase n=1 Tax=uncultured Castellaniella sp. TaxID=647907 RepID=UPI00263374B7|nr:thiamine-phosphate kinase [uncultured Castellaniella sp.]
MPSGGEFDLIARYFSRPAPSGMLGVGDDCALLAPSQGCELAVSTDMLIEGRHFFPDTDPGLLGHKALAVNLSDLAAMGAKPLACTLAISLPRIDEAWLQAFADGFHALSRECRCPLVGGDTTGGSSGVVLSITVMGEVRHHHALRRDAARAGDDVWVSGTLGGADVALRLVQGRLPRDPARLRAALPFLERPVPRLKLGRYLAGIAHAAIDISDGLLQDLGHILDASHCAAELWLDALPADPVLDGLDEDVRRDALLAGGDVYELCFTAHPRRREQIEILGRQLGLRLSRIGAIQRGSGVRVLDAAGDALTVAHQGFDHFADSE